VAAERKIAHEIVVDNQKNEIRIDGIAFPYYVMEQPEIMSVGDGMLGAVQVGILADNVTFISSNGETQHPVVGSHEADLEWARRRAEEIVLLGLRDIIKQLDPAKGAR
jgi:hypothetical protein